MNELYYIICLDRARVDVSIQLPLDFDSNAA